MTLVEMLPFGMMFVFVLIAAWNVGLVIRDKVRKRRVRVSVCESKNEQTTYYDWE